MDAMMHYRHVGILFIFGHESYAKYILPAHGLYGFLGGGGAVIATALCEKHKNIICS